MSLAYLSGGGPGEAPMTLEAVGALCDLGEFRRAAGGAPGEDLSSAERAALEAALMAAARSAGREILPLMLRRGGGEGAGIHWGRPKEGGSERLSILARPLVPLGNGEARELFGAWLERAGARMLLEGWLSWEEGAEARARAALERDRLEAAAGPGGGRRGGSAGL